MRLLALALSLVVLAPVAASIALPVTAHRAVGGGFGAGEARFALNAPVCRYLAATIGSDGTTITATLTAPQDPAGCPPAHTFSVVLSTDVWGELLASGGGTWDARTESTCGSEWTHIGLGIGGTSTVSIFTQARDHCAGTFHQYSAAGVHVS